MICIATLSQMIWCRPTVSVWILYIEKNYNEIKDIILLKSIINFYAKVSVLLLLFSFASKNNTNKIKIQL